MVLESAGSGLDKILKANGTFLHLLAGSVLILWLATSLARHHGRLRGDEQSLHECKWDGVS